MRKVQLAKSGFKDPVNYFFARSLGSRLSGFRNTGNRVWLLQWRVAMAAAGVGSSLTQKSHHTLKPTHKIRVIIFISTPCPPQDYLNPNHMLRGNTPSLWCILFLFSLSGYYFRSYHSMQPKDQLLLLHETSSKYLETKPLWIKFPKWWQKQYLIKETHS